MRSTTLLLFIFPLTLLVLPVQPIHGQDFRAVNDTIDMLPGFSKTVNLLANDVIPTGDSVRVTGGFSAGGGSVISTWHYQGIFTYLVPNRGVGTLVTGTYTLINLSSAQSSTAQMVFRIRDFSYDTLKLNDVEAVFTVSGFHFMLPFNNWHPQGFFIPKGSGKTTVYANTFWIGGLDEQDSLHIAAERYRQGPNIAPAGTKPDFYAGPVMDSAGYSMDEDTTWNQVWNLDRSEIEYHKSHWNELGYKPVRDILTWPGNGNVSLGQAAMLAPFHDENGDGIYHPLEGDYPEIRGDQCLFFIFNDDRGPHLETTGNKLKAEIHGMGYAFDLPGDSAFSKTIFLNYKIFNRSARTYHDVFLGTYTDFDIGFWNDDYVQCDVERGSMIGYNGKAIDGTGQPEAYGAHPPAQAVAILAGPWLEPTGADRPRFDNGGHPLCNESVNGTGFGDGIADNERLGLSTFSVFSNSYYFPPPGYMESPQKAAQYYNYMKAVWMDGTPVIYGGNGHPSTGGYGPEARFIYPAESDTLNWGCGCRQPNGPVKWSEETAHNMPYDRICAGATGPFTFHPGDVQEIDIAFIWARDYTSDDTLASVTKLRSMIDTVRKAFVTNRLPGGGSFLGVDDGVQRNRLTCNIYPNPAGWSATIDFGVPLLAAATLMVTNSAGQTMESVPLPKGSVRKMMDVSRYPSGLYLFHLHGDDLDLVRKVAVIR